MLSCTNKGKTGMLTEPLPNIPFLAGPLNSMVSACQKGASSRLNITPVNSSCDGQDQQVIISAEKTSPEIVTKQSKLVWFRRGQ